MAAFSESSYKGILPKCFTFQTYLKIIPLFFLLEQLELKLAYSESRTEMGLGVA